MTNKTKEFQVSIVEEVHYRITVKAKNEDEARRLVWGGEVDFGDKDIDWTDIIGVDIV